MTQDGSDTITAKDAYAETMAAKRGYVLGAIKKAARDRCFAVDVYVDGTEDLMRELIANGFAVSRKDSRIRIDWSAPKPAPLQRSMAFG